ncbi:hypothetical protein MNQ98_13430 [Paenibacillus sp. N3/727]|uniref:hypothetical protein n=1 Tax=Paenibacillus sp. N3/727 TaxID=2925845 RepID=UPI001F531F76|nr:hypothetical protein [Paenibacillus sp. N3/727]UNK20952.1 hypothetical protein MNQ98_13430 [Paenibacillus sp. N3/727]
MKNKFLAGIGVAVLTFGLGTMVYADVNDLSFQDMLPFMKQMHPGASEQQLNEMYESCHGNNGGMMRSGGQTSRDAVNSGHMMRGNGGPMMWDSEAGSLQDS